MSAGKISSVATQVPTTLDELADCDLPQNVRKQYGEQLVKNINAYITQESLQQYIEDRPKKKKTRTAAAAAVEESKPVLIDVPDSDDEFGDDGIDYSAIQIPAAPRQPNSNARPGAVAAAAPKSKPNPYSKFAHKGSPKPTPRTGSKLKSKKSSYF